MKISTPRLLGAVAAALLVPGCSEKSPEAADDVHRDICAIINSVVMQKMSCDRFEIEGGGLAIDCASENGDFVFKGGFSDSEVSTLSLDVIHDPSGKGVMVYKYPDMEVARVCRVVVDGSSSCLNVDPKEIAGDIGEVFFEAGARL